MVLTFVLLRSAHTQSPTIQKMADGFTTHRSSYVDSSRSRMRTRVVISMLCPVAPASVMRDWTAVSVRRQLRHWLQPLSRATRCRQKAQQRCRPRYAFLHATRCQLGPQTCYYRRTAQTPLPVSWTRPISWLRHCPRLTRPRLLMSQRRLAYSACLLRCLHCPSKAYATPKPRMKIYSL